jgi:hypothetical protein
LSAQDWVWRTHRSSKENAKSTGTSLGADVKLLGYVAAVLFFSLAIMLMLTLRQAGRGSKQWLWDTLFLAISVALNTAQESIPQFWGLLFRT